MLRMTTKPNNSTPCKRGQPTAYRLTFPAQAKVFCMECGGTGDQLAKLFGVSSRTVDTWLVKYPEFKAAVQAGWGLFAIGTAEQCLLKRVKGYDYDEITYEKINNVMVEVKRVTKHIPPSDVAIFFLLCNKSKKDWQHAQRIEHSGPDGGPIPMQVVDFANIPPLVAGGVQ
jgi:hypothetical protein